MSIVIGVLFNDELVLGEDGASDESYAEQCRDNKLRALLKTVKLNHNDVSDNNGGVGMMDEMDEDEGRSRLRKQVVDSKFRPHRLWSFPGVATARAEMTGPSPSCLGNQAAAECTSSPVGRHGALLAASRARSSRPHGRNGMLWTRPTSGRRCAAPATLQ